MEDLGGRIKSGKAATTSQAAPEQQDPVAAREMLTPALRANLGKEGYKLIGTQPGQPGVARPAFPFFPPPLLPDMPGSSALDSSFSSQGIADLLSEAICHNLYSIS